MVGEMIQIMCEGRGFLGEEILVTPISVVVELYTRDHRNIQVSPRNCPHNTGGHGQRCKAAHPEQDKVGEGIECPYSFDYPYALEFPSWRVPAELEDAIKYLSKKSTSV